MVAGIFERGQSRSCTVGGGVTARVLLVLRLNVWEGEGKKISNTEGGEKDQRRKETRSWMKREKGDLGGDRRMKRGNEAGQNL